MSHEQDGQETFICNTVSTRLKGASVTQLSVYPNPTNDVLNLSLETQDIQKMVLAMHSVLGQKIALVSTWDLNPGVNTKRLNLEQLTTGIYVLTITNETTGATQIKRIIKE